MKKMILSLVLIVAALPFLAQSQISSSDLQKGTIVTAANEKLEGSIRDQSKNKGNIVFVSTTGKKKIYTPAELSGFTLNGTNYISYASDFYKVVIPGGKASLYLRVTDNSGKMLYNGAEAISITTAEGKTGDYYVQIGSDSKWMLVTQKNFENALSTAFADCTVIVSDIKTKQIDYAQIGKAVEKYNSCH